MAKGATRGAQGSEEGTHRVQCKTREGLGKRGYFGFCKGAPILPPQLTQEGGLTRITCTCTTVNSNRHRSGALDISKGEGAGVSGDRDEIEQDQMALQSTP